MSFSTLPAPSDVIGINSTLHSHRYSIDGDRRRDSNRRSPTMTKPNSPLFRSSFPADVPPQLASIYNSPYAAAAMAAAVAGQANVGLATNNFPTYGRTHGAGGFYPGIGGHEGFRRSPYISHLDFCWPQNFRSLDAIVGPRTKAPREATSILKSWLNEHKDNPYPTKSEKMTLSIVTHMTLTQVSTWFANARRRIKKENKMTWTPKTRCGDRDGNSSNEDDSEKDREHHDRMHYRESRDLLSEERERNQMELDRREQRLSDGASSSRSFSPESTYRAPSSASHPMFSGLSNLNPQFYSAAAAAAAAASLLGGGRSAGRPRLPQFRSDWDAERDLPPTDLSTNRTKPENNWTSEEPQKKMRSPPNLLALEKGSSKKEDDRSFGDPSSKPASPFVQLKHDATSSNIKKENVTDSHSFLTHNSTDAVWPGTEGSDRKKPIENGSPGICKEEGSSDQYPAQNPSRSETSRVRSSDGGLPEGDEDPRHLESPRENLPSRHSARSENEEMSPRPLMPGFNPAFFMPLPGQLTSPLAKHDPLTTWIREFQQLVASGQELKAKQALATALTVAAKAGASSGCHLPLNSPEFRAENPFSSPLNRPSSSGSSVESNPRLHRVSPESASNCKSAFPFPPNQPPSYLQPPRADEKYETILPLARPDRHSSSEGSPSYSKNDLLQSDNTPMNLSKSSTKKNWRRGDEQTTIEV